ncbi:hypothetical protein DPMN_058303 [Dreissena polymorpha]|uniref:Uncharacterized protein n=1 Tax=Dreissena polymorpha TaxID=45954 RepID=A0A9D4C1S6_DREPO|nr:hypothetical protein DPMN_058303 [Dreissena polymorpha]
MLAASRQVPIVGRFQARTNVEVGRFQASTNVEVVRFQASTDSWPLLGKYQLKLAAFRQVPMLKLAAFRQEPMLKLATFRQVPTVGRFQAITN